MSHRGRQVYENEPARVRMSEAWYAPKTPKNSRLPDSNRRPSGIAILESEALPLRQASVFVLLYNREFFIPADEGR
jgi:hypothetical protein